MSELLSPAGNFQKLKSALLYGADAVYCAGKCFGMRSAADNFETEELYEAVKYTHALGKKIYLTLNTLPSWHEYEALEGFLNDIKDSGLDAFIVADPGVLTLVKKVMPRAELHISTQAGAHSHADCNFWQSLGATRVVLARELSLDDIGEIKKRISPELELETFIHGSMCVSFSGRCLLSENLVGRDANKGACAQPCRWSYNLFEIAEEKRPGMRFPVTETDRGTFIMSSKDMCMIEHIPELLNAGIASFKIEGRMKSAYYAAVTANAYRMAIDAYLKDPEGYVYNPAWKRELESVSHREYCTGYFFDRPKEDGMLTDNPGYIREKAYLAVATGYDKESGRAFFIQRNKAVTGENAELLSPGKCGVPLVLSEMQNEEGLPIDSAPHPFMPFSVKVPFPVKAGDILRGGEKP
ncbi:MAG: U32 family peptidase [Clostridia bacterium]|nr:U32 family peptidase [Clostridia bacterium]